MIAGCWEALKNLTRAHSRVMADILVSETPQIRARLDAGGSLLDIGTGGGYALVEYARRFPAATIVGIELDEASVALASKTIAEAELKHRVRVVHAPRQHHGRRRCVRCRHDERRAA